VEVALECHTTFLTKQMLRLQSLVTEAMRLNLLDAISYRSLTVQYLLQEKDTSVSLSQNIKIDTLAIALVKLGAPTFRLVIVTPKLSK
jgi:hypothetical protein